MQFSEELQGTSPAGASYVILDDAMCSRLDVKNVLCMHRS